MRNKNVQLSLFDTYTDVADSMEANKPRLIRLLEEHLDIEALIPVSFYSDYDQHMGRKRINPLES